MQFGREVRRRRKALGLTLEELAHRADLTPHHLSAIETGKTDPRLSTILKLSKALGRVPPGELLGSRADLSPGAIDTAKLFDSVGEDVQQAVATILRVAAKARR